MKQDKRFRLPEVKLCLINKEKMKSKAVRLHGEKDLRLEDIDLPQIKSDEILAEVVSDSLCMSSIASTQGRNIKEFLMIFQKTRLLAMNFAQNSWLVRFGKVNLNLR